MFGKIFVLVFLPNWLLRVALGFFHGKIYAFLDEFRIKDLCLLVVISNSSSFFLLPQFRIPNSYTVASICSIDISQNYLFNPQWAIFFNHDTNSFLVGRVIITYPAPRNEALISHWIASSADDLLSDFTACQGSASAIPRSSTSKTLIK
ncbi:hypothetical protein RirG_131630 [Rhizophagus irregularis DAOM 197198w]|uniref:Uncharacterized protein n=1 Tax=Rhizophagus irregularis (strain DAOM 197198w) TaxID=1432141 RepID=A0A015J7U8_RHIIW|nr:hypothetical protein RirG_131630 [Rhizophagus irregularis DAOM 197198w]